MQMLKSFARAVLPEPVLRPLRSAWRLASGAPSVAPAEPAGPPDWEAVADTDAVWQAGQGWSHESIVARPTEGWQAFLQGIAEGRPAYVAVPDDPSVPVDVAVHNTLMVFIYLLGRVASEAQAGRPSVLDWGGGIGQHYRFARAFYPGVDWDYVIREVPGLAAAGAVRNPEASFVTSDDAALARRYSAVYASASIMYARNLYASLGRLCDAAVHYLLVTRTPFVLEHDDFVVVQRPRRYGYDTEYAGWFLNLPKFRRFVESRGFVLDREFPLAERPFVANAPEQCRYRALLFRRVGHAA